MIPTIWLLIGFSCSAPSLDACIPIYRPVAFETSKACNERLAAYREEASKAGLYGTVACVEVKAPERDA